MQARLNRLRLLLSFVFVATLLVACGDSTATTAPQASTTTAAATGTAITAAAGTATTAAAATGVSGTLKVWFPGNAPAEIEVVTKKLAPAFEAAF